MASFGAGLVVGLVIGGAAGAGVLYLATRPAAAPLAADAGRPAAPAPPAKPPRRHHGGKADPVARAGDRGDDEGGDEPIPTLTAADTAMASEGDSLRPGAHTVNMAGGEAHDLAQGEIDGTIATRSAAIVHCLTSARGNAPVTGRVTAGMLVGADGAVLKTRVEAPAYLLHHGLGPCLRGQLGQLHFPAAGRETVVTVPFDVHE